MAHIKASMLLSLFLGLAAASAPARAFDLGANVPVTATHLGACETLQTNAFLVPGTDACLRIGGSVIAEFSSGLPQWHGTLQVPSAGHAAPQLARDLGQPEVRGRLNLDVRMPTELGPVRVYVSLRNGRALR